MEKENNIQKNEEFFLVRNKVLPEVLKKTVKVKEILKRGDSDTINDAVEKVGMSRSAYYKYKDHIFPFYKAESEKILTISLSLVHRAGVLSEVLNKLARAKGNVLTINQGLPLQGIANASVTFETGDMVDGVENLLDNLRETEGVQKVEILGETDNLQRGKDINGNN
ncbi:ACT domain-containing protein [Natranaerofaba carboxydovora]|uniref:ACT domain-containing protein n=1 Tax=Natranaerofaba carboxydovora TaxID=2742683 RepID=UPI001F13BD93|nr:ACT domain-containing protein [Natranaerofaba carboxydovora]UMZ74887.1 hypothetical protein ACONDI_02491 [Natranaerofaba carboxydovora]